MKRRVLYLTIQRESTLVKVGIGSIQEARLGASLWIYGDIMTCVRVTEL